MVVQRGQEMSFRPQLLGAAGEHWKCYWKLMNSEKKQVKVRQAETYLRPLDAMLPGATKYQETLRD